MTCAIEVEKHCCNATRKVARKVERNTERNTDHTIAVALLTTMSSLSSQILGAVLGQTTAATGTGQGSNTAGSQGAIYLQTPDDNELDTNMRMAALALEGQARPENTMRAIKPKIDEYEDYIRKVFPHSQSGMVLDNQKVYRFMFYQTFREQKPKGGNSQQRRRRGTPSAFNIDEYNRIIGYCHQSDGGVIDVNTVPPPS